MPLTRPLEERKHVFATIADPRGALEKSEKGLERAKCLYALLHLKRMWIRPKKGGFVDIMGQTSGLR